MVFKVFCKGVYPACFAFKNHESFIRALFVAAGSDIYMSDSYRRNLFSGYKPFVESQKSELQDCDNQQSLVDFFYANISDGKVMRVLQAFGVPEKNKPKQT